MPNIGHFVSDDLQLAAQLGIDPQSTEAEELFLVEVSEDQSQAPPAPATATAASPDPSNIVNQLAFIKRSQYRQRKVANESDYETQSPSSDRVEKVRGRGGHTVAASTVAASQAQHGKLGRPSRIHGQTSKKRKGPEDVWEIVDGCPEEQHIIQPRAFKSAKVGDPPTALATASSQALRASSELDTVSNKISEPYKQAGGQKASESQPEAATGGPSHNLRSRKVAEDPSQESRPRRLGATNAPAVQQEQQEPHPPRKITKDKLRAASAQPENREEGDNHTSDQQQGIDHIVYTESHDLPTNEGDNVKEIDLFLPSTSVAAQDDAVTKLSRQETRQEDEQGEGAEDADEAICHGTPGGNSYRNRNPGKKARGDSPNPDETRPELFGQDDAWHKIIAARGKVGVSEIRGQKTREIPKMKTKYVTRLVEAIREATSLYASSISGSPSSSTVPDHSKQELLEDVREHILKLSESSFEGEESKIIQDVYAHAIPKMVSFLDKALKALRAQLLKKGNVDALEEIIDVQNLLVTLCDKARDWQAKPDCNRPITQATRSMRVPLQTLQKTFREKLARREKRLRAEENHARSTQIEEESSQQAWEEAIQKRDARNRLICQAIRQKAAAERPGPRLQATQPRIQRPESRTVQGRVVAGHWSDEQDLELLTEIFAEELEDASGKAFACCCCLR